MNIQSVSFRWHFEQAASTVAAPVVRDQARESSSPTHAQAEAAVVASEADLRPRSLLDMLRFESTADKVGRTSQFTSVATSVGRRSRFNGPPILGEFQAARYETFRSNASPEVLFQIDLLLGNAGSKHEQDYLKKAVAAGNSMEDVAWLAGEIRGKDATWLRANLRLVNDSNEGSKGLIQQGLYAGAPAAAMVIRGELDPVYALRVRQGNADITKVDPNSPLAVGQFNMLASGNGVYTGIPAADAINQLAFPGTGLIYQPRNGYRNTAVFDAINVNLAAGVPVAIRIDDKDAGPHILVITGVIDGDPRVRDPYSKMKYVVHDPWDGKTRYLSRHELMLDTQGGGPNGVVETYVA